MDFDILKTDLRSRLTNSRYEHTIRVHDTALELAEKYGAAKEKVAIAALLHDYAKCESAEWLKEKIMAYRLPVALLAYDVELWHGPVGAEVVKEAYHIHDEDILAAIRYHTTGKEAMSLIQLIIFVADYIEPGREFPGVDEVRRLAQRDLHDAAKKILQNTIKFLIDKNATIYPDTLMAYNYLIDYFKE